MTYEDLRSDKALICHREINSDQGSAKISMVLLSDGHLLDCGSGPIAERRARALAAMLNEAGPHRLSKEALKRNVS